MTAIIMGVIASNVIGAYAGAPNAPKPHPANHKRQNSKTVKASAPAPKPAAIQPIPAPAGSTGAPAWTKLPLYVEQPNEATQYYQDNPAADGAALVKRAGEAPVAHWFGDWDADVRASVDAYVGAAAQANAIPVAVLYNMAERGCGNYSAGGAASSAAYVDWGRQAAAGIGGRQAVVILEPDALAGLDCLPAADQQARYGMLAQAVSTLKTNPNTWVYIDAGNPGWQTANTMAQRLKSANIAQADGFSLNVSNYMSTARNQAYGNQLAALVGNKHYVIDTSRSGNSNLSPDNWCNSPGAALGSLPTTTTGSALNDAQLWVKRPWESDGACNGGPTAGMPYWQFMVQLAKNAGWQ